MMKYSGCARYKGKSELEGGMVLAVVLIQK